MSIVSQTHPFVVGVDTHAKKHVYAILTAAGELIETRDFPTSDTGIKRALTWVGRRTGGDASTLWVIEGAASYGAILADTVADAGGPVAEAARMDAKARHGVGKSDPMDAYRIASIVLPTDTNRLRGPRLNEGARAALRVLVTARDALTTERTRHVNALTALLRVNPLGIDGRKRMSGAQIGEVSMWRTRDEALELQVARSEAVRLAVRVTELDDHLKANAEKITELVKLSEAKDLLDVKGIGPVVAAVCLTAWSHQGRVRSEAAYASLAGVNPIPASSGNTVRHRLNRGGDRKLNKALHTAALVRMAYDEETRVYVEKRTQEGKSLREIRRCIKRYLARKIYRIRNAAIPEVLPA
ncbi:IS110 family transposase [Glutamicibacter nicotianae]|uniref:IS110 family transposase n=1 Tax=Glutamicibacter nicotianae TaxID=37929 RepID=UPI0019563582|nr:IS110 family transposase [Glutamicibacter nicotianae]MBM7768264.1 transposase [Glutamicibacter nicotianae]